MSVSVQVEFVVRSKYKEETDEHVSCKEEIRSGVGKAIMSQTHLPQERFGAALLSHVPCPMSRFPMTPKCPIDNLGYLEKNEVIGEVILTFFLGHFG